MNSEYLLFSMVSLFLAIAGLYCILVSRNLIRIIIGIELIT